MKKILSLILTAAMLLSAVVMTAGAEGTASADVPTFNAPSLPDGFDSLELNADQVDSQGIYYSLDAENKTATVGKNTYADTASADAGLTTTEIVIPATVTFGGETYTVIAIGRNAFDGTAITKITTAATVKTIGEFAFAGCTALETVLAYSVEDIAGFAFWGCTALNVVFVLNDISNQPGTIGGGAFWNCTNLNGLSVYAEKIMTKAFEGCDNLDFIISLNSTAPETAADAISMDVDVLYRHGDEGYADHPYFDASEYENTFIDVEDVYGTPGETVTLAVMNQSVMADSEVGVELDIRVRMPEGFELNGIYGGAEYGCTSDILGYDPDDSFVTINVADGAPGVLFYIEGTVDPDATSENRLDFIAYVAHYDWEGYGYDGGYGYITICDHENTKTVTVKAASCDEAGVENTVCTACGTVLSTADVDAKGHTYKDFVIAPTCTEIGYTRHICECCADAYSDAEVAALGHDWDDGNVKVQASTSKEGLVTYTCNTCGATKDVTIPKIVYGDADGNSKINLGDVSLILKYIAKWEIAEGTFNSVNADVDCNSKINLADVSMILKYIAKWDVTFGPKK